MRRSWRQILAVGAAGAFIGAGCWGLLGGHAAGAEIDLSARHLGISGAHVLGTDGLGRDLFHRALLGTRGFFIPGVLAIVIAVTGGVLLGALGGYYPEDRVLGAGARWLAQGLRSGVGLTISVPATLPRFVCVLLVSAAVGFRPLLIGVVAGVLYLVEIALEVQTRVAAAFREEFVEALRADGASEWWLLGYHVLFLHCRAIVVRHACHLWAFVLMLETSLSFMPGEYGIQEPEASWGNMLQRAGADLALGHWLPALVPTIAIVGTVVALTHLGDALAEARWGRPLERRAQAPASPRLAEETT